MLGIDILRNLSQNTVEVLRRGFWGFGYPNDTVLAKTMDPKPTSLSQIVTNIDPLVML